MGRALVGAIVWSYLSVSVAGEAGNLGAARITQADVVGGALSLEELRSHGLRIFTTPFNKLDGYGDGPMNPADTVSPGGRPTLGGNGTLLRVNGLDAQTCLECHSIVSNASIPAQLGIGGVGGSNSNALIKPVAMDPADLGDLDGAADFDGRFANPPFLFGAGGVELLAIEMTQELQRLKAQALANPGTRVALHSKGVAFGSIVAGAGGELDTSGVEGVDADLIVRPFGRKGEFATTRDFDVDAMQFHFGMQPVEAVGADVDGDGDGVVNEVLVGELSALQVFALTSPPPRMAPLSAAARRGQRLFGRSGCDGCHRPSLDIENPLLPLRFPADPLDPTRNVYLQVDLAAAPTGFTRNAQGGVTVPLFADLKRHDMGDGLRENFALASERRNREFTTARLWGVADTAPYLHDGRATTLTEAIMLHGGEARPARDAFAGLSERQRDDLLDFLRSLRTPEQPFDELLRR